MYFLKPTSQSCFEMKGNTIEVAQCMYVILTANLTKLFEMKANTIEVAHCIHVFFTANLRKVFEIKTNSIEVAHIAYMYFLQPTSQSCLRWKQILLK